LGAERIVTPLLRGAKRWLEAVTGYDIQRFGTRSFALVDRTGGRDAWFAYRAQLRAILEDHRVDLVIDVGANEGQFASALRSIYSGEILSFEPVGAAFEKLTAAARGDARWMLLQLALGSESSRQVIHVADQTKFSSLHSATTFCAERFGDVACHTRDEVVTVRRLDEVLAERYPDLLRRRIFLKIDTQGHDADVFNGLGRASRHVIGLQSELSLIPLYENIPHWTQSLLVYEREGFRVVGLYPTSRDRAGRVIEYEGLLVRHDLVAPEAS
jgi:FkbM family methyltransferase